LPAVRWWPLVGVAALVVLGYAVGHGSTSLDDWFHALGAEHPLIGRLLFFTDARVLFVATAIVFGAALAQSRWRFAAVVAVAPLAAIVLSRLAKRFFDRYRDDALAYPSGHTTTAFVIVGLVVLLVGVSFWSLTIAGAWMALGVLGQGVSYHYFTDAIGALFLGSALVCLAAWAAGLDRCQPRCDLRHSGG
jgi:hypothetical protein